MSFDGPTIDSTSADALDTHLDAAQAQLDQAGDVAAQAVAAARQQLEDLRQVAAADEAADVAYRHGLDADAAASIESAPQPGPDG